jgi:hypothetical protein
MAPPYTPQAAAGVAELKGVCADAEAIKTFADLAQKAAGAIETASLSPPSGSVGLPTSVPVAKRVGKEPAFSSLKSLFEDWREKPARRKGVAEVTTLASFIDLVNRHKGDHSALFARTLWPEPSLTGVIDYHDKDLADNCDHRVDYAFPVTEEFTAWIDGDGKPMTQFEFGAFVEEHISDLSVPLDSEREEYEPLFKTKFAIPTEMVMLARGLKVNVEERVVNAHLMQSGEAEIHFSTEHKNGDGEPLVVPGLFMLRLPLFVDGSLVGIPARLRYRVKNGVLEWTYAMYRWKFWLRQRVQSDFAIAVQQTGLPGFEGAPEA